MSRAAPAQRERAKARRRRAIQLSAFELFAERGYEATTLRDIAERAEVAPRTIAAYFPTKADIAVSRNVDLADRLVAVLESDPDLGFVDAVDRWLAAESETMDREVARAAVRMEETEPGIATRGAARLARAQEVGAPRLLAAIGLPAGHPLAAVVAGAAGAAISGYLGVMVRAEESPALHADFLTLLRAILGAAGSRQS